MEQEKMKRVRDHEADIPSSLENNNAKKRDLYGINIMKKEKKDLESEKGSNSNSKTSWDSSHLSFGVFDFPWLKDGVISQKEAYFLEIEGKFSSSSSSSLEHEDAAFNAIGIDFSEAYSFCETPEASKMMVMENLNNNSNLWKPFESDGLEIKAEDVDCIWSSLLNNKPLSSQQEDGDTL